jgi:hypothetical protein
MSVAAGKVEKYMNDQPAENVDDQIRKELSRDPLQEAENLAGESYKDNESVTWLGMAIMQDRRKVLDSFFKRDGKTYCQCYMDRWLDPEPE